MSNTKVDMEQVKLLAQIVTEGQFFAFRWINKGLITNNSNILNHIIYSDFL